MKLKSKLYSIQNRGSEGVVLIDYRHLFMTGVPQTVYLFSRFVVVRRPYAYDMRAKGLMQNLRAGVQTDQRHLMCFRHRHMLGCCRCADKKGSSKYLLF